MAIHLLMRRIRRTSPRKKRRWRRRTCEIRLRGHTWRLSSPGVIIILHCTNQAHTYFKRACETHGAERRMGVTD
jgi:hypothetical protein